MTFYAVDYALDQKYFVEQNAFLQSVILASKYVKNIEVLNYDVKIIVQDLFINLEVMIPKKVSYELAITSLTEAIEDSVYSLIDVNPTNIKIDILQTTEIK